MNDYIQTMRKLIGHETLLTVGCGAIIEDSKGRILLQHRKDQENWCIPGGVMEVGETCEETVIREVFEETNLVIKNTRLFGIYSGQNSIRMYPNGDKIFSIQVIFFTREYEGILKSEGDESLEHLFFFKKRTPGATESCPGCFHH